MHIKAIQSKVQTVEINCSLLSTKGGSHLSYGVKFDPETNLPLKGHLERIELIKSAFRQGINYLDIAPLYGAGRCEVIAGMVSVLRRRQNHFS